ncbi:hypothetical protein OTU49_004791 [Cherax quadricarinatus]|uniref:Uncharacterized protein n=1 Tax=Cherax quadricarinatus TaxID=27406 RepID=A0AAW0XBV2_CHEQU
MTQHVNMTNQNKGDKSPEEKREKMDLDDGVRKEDEGCDDPREDGCPVEDTRDTHQDALTKQDGDDEEESKARGTMDGEDNCGDVNDGNKQHNEDEHMANGEEMPAEQQEVEVGENDKQSKDRHDKNDETAERPDDSEVKELEVQVSKDERKDDVFEERSDSNDGNEHDEVEYDDHERRDSAETNEPKSNSSEKEDKSGSSGGEKDGGSALLSLQQMDDAMAKCGSSVMYHNLVTQDPTVAQLLAQSAASPIQWPKDRMLPTRHEHLMNAAAAAEQKPWPLGIDFQSSEHDSKTTLLTTSSASLYTSNCVDAAALDSESRKRRQLEVAAEVERQRLQALLHPSLQHTLSLNKSSSSWHQIHTRYGSYSLCRER